MKFNLRKLAKIRDEIMTIQEEIGKKVADDQKLLQEKVLEFNELSRKTFGFCDVDKPSIIDLVNLMYKVKKEKDLIL